MKHGVMSVKKGQVLRIPATTSGCSISCLAGVLWLTRENDHEDHIITTDTAFVLLGEGLSVMEAITDCVVRITHGECEERGMYDLA